GVAVFTLGIAEALAARPDVEASAYALTWRGRGRLPGMLPAGVTAARGPMAARPLRWAWQRSNHPAIELWTGAIDVVHGTNFVVPRKDHPGLVHAFDMLADRDRDVRLVIAGPDGWGADALAGAVADARHRDRVIRVGYVADDQRARLLHDAAAFVFPSVYEGFGLPPLEAMAAGVP